MNKEEIFDDIKRLSELIDAQRGVGSDMLIQIDESHSKFDYGNITTVAEYNKLAYVYSLGYWRGRREGAEYAKHFLDKIVKKIEELK